MKQSPFRIDITILANNQYKWSPEPIHIGDAEQVKFFSKDACEVRFIPGQNYFNQQTLNVGVNGALATLKPRTPQDPHARASRWELYGMVEGKPKKLVPVHSHATAAATVARKAMNYGASTTDVAVLEVDVTGEPDAVIQP
jgi:hypothetical protein